MSAVVTARMGAVGGAGSEAVLSGVAAAILVNSALVLLGRCWRVCSSGHR